MPIPPWLKQAFQNAYGAKSAYKIKSWDEVFGRPLKKGIRLARERRNNRIANDIYERVVERHIAGEPIDKNLFEAVGKNFGVGGTVASELYYEVKELEEALELPGRFKKTRKLPGKLKNIREY